MLSFKHYLSAVGKLPKSILVDLESMSDDDKDAYTNLHQDTMDMSYMQDAVKDA